MSLCKLIMTALPVLVLAACGSGDSSRSGGGAGKAPPNPPYDGSGNTNTATDTDSATETATGSETDTSTSTGTDFGFEKQDCDAAITLQTQVEFKPKCKALVFFESGNFQMILGEKPSGPDEGRVIFFQWAPKDKKPPVKSKSYTVADIKDPQNPDIIGGFYEQRPTLIILPPEPPPTAYTIKFIEVPDSKEAPYEIQFDFDQPDLEFPDLSRNYKATVKGNGA